MIWVWLKRFAIFLALLVGRLLIPPPPVSAPPVPKEPVDVNEQCPACGHRNGKITAVKLHSDREVSDVLIRHTCQVCGAHWHHKTLYESKNGTILPAS